MSKSDERLVPILFPHKGLDLSLPFAEQPPLTTFQGQNVRWYECLTKRERGGSRAGLSKYATATVAGTHEIQDLGMVVICLPPHVLKGFILVVEGSNRVTVGAFSSPSVGVTLNGVALDTVVPTVVPANPQCLAYMSASDAGLSAAALRAVSTMTHDPTNGPPWTVETFKIDGTNNSLVLTSIGPNPVVGQRIFVWLFQLAWSGTVWSIASTRFQVSILMGDGQPGFPATQTLTWAMN